MWVVKIGGSLETAPGLRALLALLADYGRSRAVIVPGGGRFAERVRAEQRVTGMDDAAAHHLALRAMEQYGTVLCEMEPRLYAVAGTGEIGDVAEGHTVPVWSPTALLSTQEDIPASWQVTSDSLALWFADKINAEGLILVKSLPGGTNDAQALAVSGYLDAYFPQMMKKASLDVIACIAIDEREALQQALSSGTIPSAFTCG